MKTLILSSALTVALAITGCIDMESINQMAAEQRAAEAQRRAARMAGASKDRVLRKIADGKLTTAERLQWLEQVKDNATLYEAFSRVFTEYGKSDKTENMILDAIIRRIDVSTKADAIKFINWRWKDARNAEGRLAWPEQMRKLGNAMCCEKAKTAFAKLDEQDIGAILEDHKLAWGHCACKQCHHILKSRFSKMALSADMLCKMLTDSRFEGAEDPHRIEERLLAKIAEISPEKADDLLSGRGDRNPPFYYLNNEKLIVELIAKLPPEKRGEPMSRLNKFRANKPCIVNGVDWKGLFEIIDGEAVVKRRFAETWGGYNLPENLVVPCSLAGFPVTRIECEAFCKFKVKRVVVPDSVRSIGREAFGYSYREHIAEHSPCAAHLESVVIGSGVTNVEENAFAHCLSLTNVTIQGRALTVGNGAFKGCEKLENVTIPADADIVFGDDVFRNCAKLKPINGNFTYSVGSTFDGCDSYHDENGFRIIGGVLERYCGNATAVSIPSGVKEIWSKAFEDNTKLKTVIIPDGVKRIGSYAFSGCRQLREITIPKSVETIGAGAFKDCIVMRKAVLLNANTEIKDNAFRGCKNLYEVETPEGKFSPHTWDDYAL